MIHRYSKFKSHNSKIVFFSIILTLLFACNHQEEYKTKSFMNEKVSDNPNKFIPKDSSFLQFLENFNDIRIPFDFQQAWNNIGGEIHNKINIKNKFTDNLIIKNAIFGDIDELYCAYRIPISDSIISLVYLNDEGLTYQVILASYSNTGKPIDAVPIHGYFNDSEYFLSGFIDKDIYFHLYDTLNIVNGEFIEPPKFEFYKKIKVNENGKFVNLQVELGK